MIFFVMKTITFSFFSYIKASFDRVTVIFSTLFKDSGDSILGKIFLQEFGAVKASQTAPQVLYRYREPPAELQDCKDALVGENVGYVTFVLFPRHTKPEFRDNTIDLLHIFRDYLHYHIKCSKVCWHHFSGNMNLFLGISTHSPSYKNCRFS